MVLGDRLADVFARARPGGAAPDDDLDRALTELVARARVERAAIAVDAAALVAHAAARIAPDADPVAAIGALRAGDLALALACLGGDRAALASFDAELVATARPALRGMRASDTEIDDVLQLARTRLLVAEAGRRARLADYAGRGDLARWVKAVVVRTFLNSIRGVHRDVLVGDDQFFDEVASPAVDPELAYLKQRYRAELREAFLEALAGISDTHRNVLRYRYLDGLTVEEIGRLHRVHRATTHRWLAEAREALRRGTEALLRRKLSLTEAELDSLQQLIESQLDWTLSRAFA